MKHYIVPVLDPEDIAVLAQHTEKEGVAAGMVAAQEVQMLMVVVVLATYIHHQPLLIIPPVAYLIRLII